jgi:hypothetical protein
MRPEPTMAAFMPLPSLPRQELRIERDGITILPLAIR